MVVGQVWQLKNDMYFMIDASNAVLLTASHDGHLCSKLVQAIQLPRQAKIIARA